MRIGLRDRHFLYQWVIDFSLLSLPVLIDYGKIQTFPS